MVSAEYIRDVLTLDLKSLQSKYKQKSDKTLPTIKNERSLRVLRRKYTKLLKELDMEQLSPEPDNLSEARKLLEDVGISMDNLENAHISFHVGYIRNAEGEIEYTKPLPSIRITTGDTEGFPTAVAANITPSDRQAPERPYKTIFVFSDAQIDYRRVLDYESQEEQLVPLHDERALRVARLICRDVQPETIVNCGDTVDLSSLSRFKPDSDHFHRTLGPSFQRVHDYYAELRSDNPDARIVEVDSNHHKRLKDFVLKNMPQLYNIRQAGSEVLDYPVMTYPHLANLRALNVEWVSGYGAAEFVYGEEYSTPPIVFKHGNTMVSGGSTAAKESKENPETHIVRGHGHRVEMHSRTNRAGNYLTSLMIGAMCDTTGNVPSYHSGVDDYGQVVRQQENWQQSVAVIYDYEGTYQFDTIYINDGKAFYNGREYDGNE